MKIRNIMLAILLILVIFVVGCSSQANEQQSYGGSGGCGVGAPASENNNAAETLIDNELSIAA